MPRIYTCTFKNITVMAPQDLISLKGAVGKACMIRRVWFAMNNTTLQTAQGVRLNVKYAPTLTVGSGGTTVTPRPYDAGDPAATFTARSNDTTQATGTFVDLVPDGGHNYGAYVFNFGKEGPVFAGANAGIVFELLSLVVGTCAFSGGAEVAEMG